LNPQRCLAIDDAATQLRAFIVIDDTTLGPACGGVRTRAYPDPEAALDDCIRLARAMTIKCALAGLAAGGGKAVVLDHPQLDRNLAFRELGRRIESLQGLFRTSGDLGTTGADLAAMAATTQYVHLDEARLSTAAGRGIALAAKACARMRGHASLQGLRVAIQGCGAIGAAAARAFREAGARVFVSDLDERRSAAIAAEVNGVVVPADEVLEMEADILAPCACGGVIDSAAAERVKAWAVCGGANNILCDAESERVLLARGITCVPDVISSAGAVIEGVGETVMGRTDRTPLIDAIYDTTLAVLEQSARTGVLPSVVAEDEARARIAALRNP
jgi:leucine dehydrogenase